MQLDFLTVTKRWLASKSMAALLRNGYCLLLTLLVGAGEL
jgi:hypothetical protein